MAEPLIAVLGGTGQQGSGIARRLALAGARIVVGSRDPARARTAVVAWTGAAGAIDVMSYADAIGHADVTILAIPFSSASTVLSDCRDRFRAGTLAIDVMVPLSFTAGKVRLDDVADGSAAEHVRAQLPASVQVAATFKTLPGHLLDDLARPLECDEFVCGDTPDARAAASAIVSRIPTLRAIDVGPLSRARAIEHLTFLAVAINLRHKTKDSRFRVVGL